MKLAQLLKGESRAHLQWFKCQGCGEWEACLYHLETDTMTCSLKCRVAASERLARVAMESLRADKSNLWAWGKVNDMKVYIVTRPFEGEIAGVFKSEKDARKLADKINADKAAVLSLPASDLPEVAVAIVETHEVTAANRSNRIEDTVGDE